MKTLLPKDGSKWTGTTGHDQFHVLHTVEIDGNTWVHYIKENAKENEHREYSCYVDSFLAMFRAVPE
jgi:hypothetical protein